ncbi:hypothetical protein BDW68DRAFT_180907 [Aspergillus falconensis]
MSSAKEQLCITFLNTLEQLDISGNLAIRAPDCIHETAPAIHESRVYFKNDYKEIWTNEGNIVTVYMSTTAAFPDEVKDDDTSFDWTFYREYIFVFGAERYR